MDASPDDSEELAAFKCQTTRANDFYVLTCFNMLMTAEGNKKITTITSLENVQIERRN